tara:strand:+ start:1025 stop:1468 length:444 start_codon:yes stop_codon:yes gene_type:complete
MNLVNKTMSGLKNFKNIEILFVILMVIYLVSNMSTPYNLAPYVNNTFSYGSMILLVLLLSIYSNPIVTILFAITSVVFVYRSRLVDHNVMKSNEVNKNRAMQDFNANKKVSTLEEEIVGSMVVKPDNIPNPETYQPVLCSSHGASEL